MSTNTLVQEQPTLRPLDHPLLVIERILRDTNGIWEQIHSEFRLHSLIVQMLTSSAVALACYGAVLGFSNGFLQALSSAIKLPVLFLLTLAICLPTLYLFNLVFGSRLSVSQTLGLILVAITVTAVLTLAFAPISLFFLITAQNYGFFKLLNVIILSLTGFIGLGFLVKGMGSLNRLSKGMNEYLPAHPVPVAASTDIAALPATPVPPAAPRENMLLLYIWILLYSFVGTQLAWTLRPFFGDPNLPFQIFRQMEGNFYSNVFQTFFWLLVGG